MLPQWFAFFEQVQGSNPSYARLPFYNGGQVQVMRGDSGGGEVSVRTNITTKRPMW